MNLTTIKQVTQNIFKKLNWKIYKPTLFTIVTFLSIFPCVLFLPEMYACENSFIENLQLFVIFFTFIFALNSKQEKHLFNWISMICIMLFLREINCGRIFFPVHNSTGALLFKHWHEILSYPYYNIPNGLFGLFVLYSIFYFFKSKVYFELWEIIKNAKIDCVNISFMFFGIITGTISENIIHNEMLEETTETLFYVAFGVLVYLYGYNKNYKIDFIKDKKKESFSRFLFLTLICFKKIFGKCFVSIFLYCLSYITH